MQYLISVSERYEYKKEKCNFSLERQLASGVFVEMVENFKGCTIQSTISDSEHSDSDKQVDKINDFEGGFDARNWLRNDYAEQVGQINDYDKQVDSISDFEKLVVTGSDLKIDPSSDPKVSTHAINRNFTQKLLISQFVTKIIPVVIGPINLPITVDMMVAQDILSSRQMVLLKESVTDATCSCAHIFRGTYGKVICTSRDKATPSNISSDENSRLSSPIPVSNPDSLSPIWTGNEDVFNPIHPSIAKGGRKDEPFDASINGFSDVNGHSTSYFSGVISLEAVSGDVADVNGRKRMKFASNSVVAESPKFVDLRLLPAHTTDKLKSVIFPDTISGGLTDKSDWFTSTVICG